MSSLSGCTLPALALIVSQFKQKATSKMVFLLEFFTAQLIIFTLINVSAALFYSFFVEVQPLILLISSFITLYFAYAILAGKLPSFKHVGGLYGVALSPCSLGFVVATAASSVDVYSAVFNSFFFALGIITPILVFAVFSEALKAVQEHYRKVELMSALLLILVAMYLAYLAGSNWRFLP